MNSPNSESWTGPAALGCADRGARCPFLPQSCSQVPQPGSGTAGGAALPPARSDGALAAKPVGHPVQLMPGGDRRALGGDEEEPFGVTLS